ncbi:hypothetical protein [Azohydromonas lata]|uniref:hypothetical protein n=1 Tax=Azohydromonas lata TaxID=45677 RepID=UPI00083105F4|nr:hypothetical protein [Azohydromonas lata]
MQYIVPTSIGDSMLVSSSVPETDYGEWFAGAVYAADQYVIRSSMHSVYKRVVAGNTTTPPEQDAINWVRVGPTNRWAMFDRVVGTKTAATAPALDQDAVITVTLKPGLVRGLALLDLDVDGLTVEMVASGETVYRRDLDPLGSLEDVDNWWDYFFDAIKRRNLLVLTDLPPYADAEITLTFRGRGAISIGSCIVGRAYSLGNVLVNASTGITDYSVKSRDEFGAVTLAERPFNKRMSLPIILDTAQVDAFVSRLSAVRATPVVWIASTTKSSLVIYGFYKDWSITIPGRVKSTLSMEIEGLV